MTSLEPHTARVCPECGKELIQTDATFCCQEHGYFFSYGPHLLVHSAISSSEPSIPRLMPWERLDARS